MFILNIGSKQTKVIYFNDATICVQAGCFCIKIPNMNFQ